MESKQSKEQREKKSKKNEQSLRELWNNTKLTNKFAMEKRKKCQKYLKYNGLKLPKDDKKQNN